MGLNNREACIVLNMLSGIGTARLEALTSAFGSPSAVLEASNQDILSVSGIGKKLAGAVSNWQSLTDLDKELNLAEKGGVEIITRYDSNYPAILKEIADPPMCLYVRGLLPDIDSLSIAIVGSRRITNYGRRMARHLAESAVFAGWTVVSGLAYGVDAVAHKAAIDGGGKTIAVIGSGLLRIHPQDHIPLAREIVDNGAVISELPMEFPASRQTFPRRNRIISGISRATLIVEAGVNSGALITANQALDQGRSVFAMPGEADNPQARGCNSLIKQGAKLTEDFNDIIEEFEFLPQANFAKCDGQSKTQETPSAGRTVHIAELSEDEVKIVDALSSGEQSVDAIANSTNIPAGKLLSLLMRLEMKQTVKQLPGKNYMLK